MIEVLTSIQQKLTAGNIFAYVDEDWGQLDDYSTHPPVKFPCALIDISGATFSNIGRDTSRIPVNRQMGDLTIELRIADLRLTNTSSHAPNSQQLQAHSIWELIEQTHAHLHGWNPTENCSKLIRTALSRVKRDDGIQEYAIRYTAELNNC
jgi:hypothetical protein